MQRGETNLQTLLRLQDQLRICRWETSENAKVGAIAVTFLGKRLNTARVLGSLIGRLDECDKVLRDILPRVHETDQIAIRKVLEPVS